MQDFAVWFRCILSFLELNSKHCIAEILFPKQYVISSPGAPSMKGAMENIMLNWHIGNQNISPKIYRPYLQRYTLCISKDILSVSPPYIYLANISNKSMSYATINEWKCSKVTQNTYLYTSFLLSMCETKRFTARNAVPNSFVQSVTEDEEIHCP